MSFLIGKSNLSAIISKNMIEYTQQKYSLNLTDQSSDLPNKYTSMPTNLISTSTIKVNCGDNYKCSECLINQNIDISNYNKNIDIINNSQNNECFSVCSCNLSSIDLNNNLVFLVGTSINYTQADKQNIATNVESDITTFTSSKTSSKEAPNWTSAIMGGGAGAILGGPEGLVAGAALGALDTGFNYLFNPKYDTNITSNATSTINSVSESFQNTINQMISSAQELTIEGSGIKIKNVSLKSIQDITMKSEQINSALNDFTNSISNTLSNPNLITQKTTLNMLTYIWDQNKNLVIGMGIVVLCSLLIWIYLEIKNALHKK